VFDVPAMLILPIFFGISGIYFGATIIDVIIAFWLIASVYKETKQFFSRIPDRENEFSLNDA